MAIKGSVLEAYTQTKRAGICVACELDDMSSGFNTAHKAVWLKLAQLECASYRKDSQRQHFHASWTCGRFTIPRSGYAIKKTVSIS